MKTIISRIFGQIRQAVVIGTLLATTPLISMAAIIDTVDLSTMGTLYALGEDPTQSVQNFEQFGQTFTAPTTDTRLNSFSLFLTEGWAEVNFRAAIYQWDGAGTVGSALFVSGPMMFDGTGADPSTGFQLFQFDTGGLDLAAGGRYVVTLSTTLNGSLQNAGWGMAYDPTANCCFGMFLDAYAGGELVLRTSQQGNWQKYLEWDPFAIDGSNGIDTAFQMSFSNPDAGTGTGNLLPVPGSFGLFAIGAIAAFGVRRFMSAPNSN